MALTSKTTAIAGSRLANTVDGAINSQSVTPLVGGGTTRYKIGTKPPQENRGTQYRSMENRRESFPTTGG